MYFDLLGSAFPDQDIVLPFHVIHDIVGQFVASDTDRLIANNTRQCDNRNLCGTPANINDHISDRLFNIQSDTQGSRHGFVYQVCFFAVHVVGRVKYRAFFYFGDTTGDTNDHFQVAEKVVAATYHFDHTLDHGFGSLEISNHAVLQRANGFDVFMGLFMHLHGSVTYCNCIAGTAVNRYDRRLVYHHLIIYHNQRIGSTQVNC